MSDHVLPEFERPPVSEVALAVHFAPLAGWSPSYAGLFWGHVRGDYPLTEVHHPIQSQLERFDDEFWSDPVLNVELADPLQTRFWFLNPPKTKLIQVQRDRFIVNWRRVTGTEPYPRYRGEMRDRFAREFRNFLVFVGDNGLGSVDVLQCEMTYVNDLLDGQDWNTFDEALRLISFVSAKGSTGFLSPPHTISAAAAFLMPPGKGRLYVQAQHLKRAPDRRELMRLQLTARGRPESNDMADVLGWMDLGREWIVRGFEDVTTPLAHQKWGVVR